MVYEIKRPETKEQQTTQLFDYYTTLTRLTSKYQILAGISLRHGICININEFMTT
jgi:hypothetical protein